MSPSHPIGSHHLHGPPHRTIFPPPAPHLAPYSPHRTTLTPEPHSLPPIHPIGSHYPLQPHTLSPYSPHRTTLPPPTPHLTPLCPTRSSQRSPHGSMAPPGTRQPPFVSCSALAGSSSSDFPSWRGGQERASRARRAGSREGGWGEGRQDGRRPLGLGQGKAALRAPPCTPIPLRCLS